ncbi:hypothetical protein [Salibacterium lacus]|uniref:Head-to-tail stopper n=1 Tax=Salibacterium lacus TaxID=1898109 RepID=A0ABW5SXY4_9BACI
MAIIPTHQSITITKAGESDGWGGTNPGEPFDVKARVTEMHEKVTNQHGDEVVSTAKIRVGATVNVTYDDTVYYEDELGRTIEKKPISIEPVRGIGGHVWLTKIHL